MFFQKNIRLFTLVLVAIFCIVLTYLRHVDVDAFTFRSQLTVDKVGYNIYLPSVFIYDFNSDNFPEFVKRNNGVGFILDDKIRTKYTYGVALLQLPFFYGAHILSDIFDYDLTGYSQLYTWSVNISTLFYVGLGLYFLYNFLLLYFKKEDSFAIILLLFLSTNLFYYTVISVGMSHPYSFFLFSLLLLIIKKTDFLNRTNWLVNLLIGLLVGLIVLIRPTSIMILLCFFLDVKTWKGLVVRLVSFLNVRKSLPIVLGVIIVILPQLAYWYYLSGSLVMYSYKNEGFNWLEPHALSLLFSPNNGLILYNPIFLLILLGIVFMFRSYFENRVFILVLFLSIVYVFSSWYAWDFGCSFGSRSFVEFYAIFCLPLGYCFLRLKHSLFFKYIVLFCVLLNLRLSIPYDGCYYGIGDWDWVWYLRYVANI